jgi:hypothetical protein
MFINDAGYYFRVSQWRHVTGACNDMEWRRR